MDSCHPRRTSCPPRKGRRRRDLESMVAEYLRTPQGDAAEARFFRHMPSLDLAIHYAALAIWKDGRSFRHQNPIVTTARSKAKLALTRVSTRIHACTSFHALHSILCEVLNPIRGLGPLYIYDCASRLGYYLKLSPEYIYLHAGTRHGAKALGLDHRRDYLAKQDVPLPLRVLAAAQIESFLCIYRGAFTAIRREVDASDEP